MTSIKSCRKITLLVLAFKLLPVKSVLQSENFPSNGHNNHKGLKLTRAISDGGSRACLLILSTGLWIVYVRGMYLVDPRISSDPHVQQCSVENQKGINAVQQCSVENQKGVNAVQQCSVENQKGTIAIDFVQ